MNKTPLRLAVWSGPRNISTALMRSWENRPDTCVIDEPFYAHYLYKTKLDHPGRDEILLSQPTDWTAVRDKLLEPVPSPYCIFYQKHMAHHYLPDMHGSWINELTHVFLLREPADMLISLDKVIPSPGLDDTGLPQQLAIFEYLKDTTGHTPLVIDSADILLNPEAMLKLWCHHLEIEFDPDMLGWPAGTRATDGIWAKYWYDSVNKSTGFESRAAREHKLPKHLEDILAVCKPYYQKLHMHRLSINS